jgi:hypothetical protein
MTERPEQHDDDELERERQESTDLGYRDSEEERAYEKAANDDEDDQAQKPPPVSPG